MTRIETKSVVEGVLVSILNAVSSGKKVELRGFGIFNTKKRSARQARNPKTGEVVALSDRYVPIFKPSIDFTKKVDTNLMGKTTSENINESVTF
jgi:nucleoid DNA-binding protein